MGRREEIAALSFFACGGAEALGKSQQSFAKWDAPRTPLMRVPLRGFMCMLRFPLRGAEALESLSKVC